jgi:uncharacterized OsmC-like protein
MAEQSTGKINGIDTDGLRQVMKEVAADPAKGAVKFAVKSEWRGQCKVHTEVSGYQLSGQSIERKHSFLIDEPVELLGENVAPNPQEVLMGAFNACMIVGYATGAAMKGITLEKLEIETIGALDLRGFLGLDATVKPGYEEVTYIVRIKGNGTPEQFREIHETVMATSPNRWNIANPIQLKADLVVE